MPDSRAIAALLSAALPVLLVFSERSAGLVGLAWLVLGSTLWWRSRSDARIAPALRNEAVRGFIAFFAVVVVLCLIHGGNWLSATHNPSRFVLVLPALVAVVLAGPSPRAYFGALAVAGLAAGLFAIAQVGFLGEAFAHGVTNRNKFGFLCATFVLGTAAAAWLPARHRPPRWLLAAGLVAGLIATTLSGTRGAWVSLLVGALGAAALLRWVRWQAWVAAASIIVLLGAGAYAGLRGTMVGGRIGQVVSDIEGFRHGVVDGSVQIRLELWRGAWRMGKEHPLLGVGPARFLEDVQAMVDAGQLDPGVAGMGHPHNEYLAWFAAGGIVGLAGLLAALLGPLVYFVRVSRGTGGRGSVSVLAASGTMLVVATMQMILTDPFFYIHYATVYYALSVAILVGFIEREARDDTARARAGRLVNDAGGRIPGLSVVVITRDEARRIERCLRSVAFADEFVVVDSGSRDDTVARARALGARVEVCADWPGFGRQKNRALAIARGPWVLSIDADEEVGATLAASIRAALAAPQFDAYWIDRLSCFGARPIRFGDWRGDRVLRLFRKDRARFTDDVVHERVDAPPPHGRLDGVLMHYTLDDYAQALEKARRYAIAGAPRVAARGRGGPVSAVIHASWTFLRGALLRAGLLDGWRGLQLAIVNAYGTWMRYRIAGTLRRSRRSGGTRAQG